LKEKELKFVEQYYTPLKFKDQKIGKYFLDFLIEDKIILELKRGQFVPVQIINQTKRYLSTLNLKLALIGCFTWNGVIIKRILNEY